jgi:predicted dienelactone hydrolase
MDRTFESPYRTGVARMKSAVPLCGLFLLALPVAGLAGGAGLAELRFEDGSRNRPVEIKVWYPVEGSREDVSVSYDLAFIGHARTNAPYLAGAGPRPLVMLSHGDRGSNVDQSWLAEALASQGYIVAAVSHWMNTWRKNTPEATLKVWDRPLDISFAIDQLSVHPVWGARIDLGRIAAAGHSAGGYTALALAGAIYSPLQMSEYCAAQGGARECSLGEGADLATIDFTQSRVSYRDPRIRAVVAMAPALGPGILPESLAGISTPALLIAARDDELLKYELNAKVYADQIPGSALMLLSRGGHFVFMPDCTLMGKAFTYFHRFDICGRRAGAVEARPGLHAQVERAVIGFFGEKLSDGR